jgi:PEGA domain
MTLTHRATLNITAGVILVVAAGNPAAQNCGVNNPILITKNNMNVDFIKTKIRSNPSALYTMGDIKALNTNIKACQNQIDNAISEINSSISALVLDKQDLLKLKDVDKIKEQITAKNDSKAQIKKEMEKDLSNITYKGLFLCITNDIDVYESKEKLANTSEAAISGDAIKNLSGIFMESMTVVKNNMMIRDYIRSIMAGEMNVEKKYIEVTLRKDKKFIYVAKVGVSPLKKPIAGYDTTQVTAGKVFVFDLMKTKSVPDLSQFGISSNDENITQIPDLITSLSTTIDQENELSGRREETILTNGNANMAKVENEIKALTEKMNIYIDEISRILQLKTKVAFDKNNLQKCVEAALQYFDTKIKLLTDKKMMIKEFELISQHTNVVAEGEPTEDVAKTAINVAKQIEASYSKVEQFSEVTEVQNYMLTNYEMAKKKDIYRGVDKIWVYPIPDNQDNFELVVVAKFKVNYQFSSTPDSVAYAQLAKEVFSAPAKSNAAKEQKPVEKIPQPVAPQPTPVPVQPPAPVMGALTVTSDPAGATVFINDKQSGTTPYQGRNLDPGVYYLRLDLPNYSDVRDTVSLLSGETANKNYSLALMVKERPQASAAPKGAILPEKKKPSQLVRRIAFGALTVAAAGIGYYCNTVAKTAVNNQTNLQASYQTATTGFDGIAADYNDQKKKANDFCLYRNVLYGLSGLMAVGFVISIPF